MAKSKTPTRFSPPNVSVPIPFIPNITPWLMPEQPFEQLMQQVGVRLAWLKSHSCPCTFSGPTIGSADPACQQCQGVGTYWDNPSVPFYAFLTWIHISRTPDEPGFFTEEKVGIVQHGEPTLTIPYTADSLGLIWQQASIYDAYVELDAVTRYNANLQVGGISAVPYQQNLSIAPSGAVTIYSQTTNLVTAVTGYTVSGAVVTLPTSYPIGTSFVVEFEASPVYVAFDRAGGAPHTRPFGGTQMRLPRRFRLQSLDLWLRARLPYPQSASPNAIQAPII
jgi:hypothetical protein